MDIDLPIILWLLARASPLPPGLNSLTTMGSGPLPENEFDDLLRLAALEIFQPGKDTTILVMGREDWIPERADQLLDQRSGKHLRAYSQEMFVAYLVSGEDPLADEKMARYLAGDHPGLRYLQDVGFYWPTTVVGPRRKGKIEADLEIGFLKSLGYTVGKRGLPEGERHKILTRAYRDVEVPTSFPDWYAAKWHSRRSSKRLKEIANSIALFCTARKKMTQKQHVAILHYEADLAWLKAMFYKGRHTFRWPSTGVG